MKAQESIGLCNELLAKMAKQIGHTEDFLFRCLSETGTVRLCYYQPGATALSSATPLRYYRYLPLGSLCGLPMDVF